MSREKSVWKPHCMWTAERGPRSARILFIAVGGPYEWMVYDRRADDDAPPLGQGSCPTLSEAQSTAEAVLEARP